jgi:hypothetical protein
MHPKIMTLSQKRIARAMGGVCSREGFVLAGGTAVALNLGHRRSIDLDWFSSKPLDEPLNMAAKLRGEGLQFETVEISRGTLHGKVSGVSVSFMEFPYPELRPPEQWKACGFSLASMEDLSAMKLAALAQRGARKDFIDIYSMCLKYRPLPELISYYQEKFSVKDIGHLLFALASFDDAESEPMPEMIWPIKWTQIKKTISSWVKAI